MDAFLLDLRYAARALRKNPRFTLLVTATLALGIGANTAVFGLVDAWLLRPLRFQDPDRLVIVLGSHVTRPTEPAIFPLYRDVVAWTEESRSFERMAGVFWRRYLLTGRGDPEQVSGMVVTTELFDTLGVAPLVGRTFNRDDLHGPPRVVLGHALWLRLTGGSPDAVGSLTLNGRPHEVIGVMPRDFDFRILDQPAGALWTLLQPGEANYGPQSTGALAVIGRLKPDVTASAAQTELLAIQERVERRFADGLRQHLPLVTALQADNTRTVGATLFTLTAAVGFVLLIACTNIATLLAVVRRSVRKISPFAPRSDPDAVASFDRRWPKASCCRRSGCSAGWWWRAWRSTPLWPPIRSGRFRRSQSASMSVRSPSRLPSARSLCCCPDCCRRLEPRESI